MKKKYRKPNKNREGNDSTYKCWHGVGIKEF